jgi:hypothetical protein
MLLLEQMQQQDTEAISNLTPFTDAYAFNLFGQVDQVQVLDASHLEVLRLFLGPGVEISFLPLSHDGPLFLQIVFLGHSIPFLCHNEQCPEREEELIKS